MIEIFSIVDEVFERLPNFYQIFTLLIYIYKKENLGRIVESNAEEEKSLIIAMLAAYLVK